MTQFYAFLDTQFFPRFQAFVTHRLFICALLLLGVVLMVDDNPILQLKGGNLTNVTSAVLGCIVLLQTMAHHTEMRRLRKSHEDLHAKVDALTASKEAQP